MMVIMGLMGSGLMCWMGIAGYGNDVNMFADKVKYKAFFGEDLFCGFCV